MAPGPEAGTTLSLNHVPDFLWEKPRPHGVLGEDYRRYLESIERVLRKCGCETFIPHRDINGWGESELTAKAVAKLCTAHVFSSDLLVAIPGSSFGTHYEVGIAVGYGIPVVLLLPSNEPSSFIVDGLDAVDGITTIRFASTRTIPDTLRVKVNELVSTRRR